MEVDPVVSVFDVLAAPTVTSLVVAGKIGNPPSSMNCKEKCNEMDRIIIEVANWPLIGGV